MAITPLDLKLRQAERMTDFSDGGGRMAATEVVDGLMNNVFSDLSDANGIIGNVSLRKIFMQVDTANVDTFLGPFIFLTDLPQNDNVSVCLFDTGSATDERISARNYYENYRVRGVKSQFVLYGDHFAGQKTIQVYCRSEIPSPDIGDVLDLAIEKTGYTPAEQFVKVEEVALRTTTTFTDNAGDFTRDVLVIKLAYALGIDFPGQEDPQRITGANAPPTVVRLTTVADAARYYGMKACTVPPAAGDTIINVGDPYIPVVPSTQAETPIVDQLAGLGARAYIKCSADNALTFAAALTGAANAVVTRYFGTPFAPGTLNITVGSVALRDDGSGGLAAVDPVNTGWSGIADYASGAFAIAKDTGFSAAVSATATAAGVVVQQTYSRSISVTAANRNIGWVFQLPGQPSAGTVNVDYLALGKWIRLRDTGRGRIAGNPGEGSATINYATGTVALTLGALPDVDSAIIVSWGTDLRARDSHGEITIPTPTYRQQLDHTGIKPGTLTMAWVSGGVAKTAAADVYGQITGAATGTFSSTAGIANFSTASVPDSGTRITYSYDYTAGVHTETFTPTAAGGAVSVTLAHPAIEPNTVFASWNTVQPPGAFPTGQLIAAYTDIADNGSGGFVTPNGGVNTIDYSTGAVVLTVEQLIGYNLPHSTNIDGYGWVIDSWTNVTGGYTFPGASPLVIRYAEAGGGTTSASESHPLPEIRIYLGAGAAGPAVSGSVRFTFRGRTYVDRAGQLYYDVSALNNTGTLGGAYDYASNAATISDYAAGSNTVTIVALLTRYVAVGITSVYFRTAGNPLRAGSFTLRATTMLGEQLIGVVDINGHLTGDRIIGDVDWRTGLTSVKFGALVTAAGNESEPWYDPAFVDAGGKIWKPESVDPGSIFFGTVVYHSIPIDPALIGVDPVRLPNDGRVAGFNSGTVGVVSHTQLTNVDSPIAGHVVDLGRDRISFIEVFDAAHTPIDSVWCAIDMNAGTLTWSDPLNLSAYTLPITIRDRIQDVALIADVQITGEITFATPVTHDYPAGAIVSNAILWTDTQARVANVFDQQTYQAGVWSDVVVGTPAAATYNTVTYPFAVSNDACIDERWAIVFTSPTAVNVIGETVGQVLTGVPINADIAPINPVTVTVDNPAGKPYFTVAKEGWGGGWAAGNVVRFNAVSATHPAWLARVVVPGEIVVANDAVRAQIYGNAH